MGADSWEESTQAPNGSRAEFLYFGPSSGKLAGWFHPPRGEAKADTGVVICQPFGYEAICSHRGTRSVAEAASALGMPALRFDYSGTGDSAEIEPEADQLEVWLGEILAAIDEMRRRTGLTRICLAGLRLGGLLATLAANRCDTVHGLILIAPVISGRRYLRDLRTTRLAGLLATGDSPENARTDDKAAGPRALEISGYSLSVATLASLIKIDLLHVEVPARCETLVIDGASMPAARVWAEQLSGQGRPVQYSALPGVLEMMITAPQFLVPSLPMIAAASAWLGHHFVKSEKSASRDSLGLHSVPDPSSNMLTLTGASLLPGAALTERPVFFGDDNQLFGIVTEPGQGEIRRRAVLLLNAGADHHVGPSRIYVSIARRWARSGYFVLRMDLAGIGDSGTRPGRPDDEVFPPAALEDIRAAIELLNERYCIRDVCLAGLCSGAYHALRAVVAGLPAGRILMVNPLNYFWKKGMMLDDLQVAEVILNPTRYRERVVSSAAWKRLLSGQVNVWRILRIYVHRLLLPVQSLARDVARSLRIPLPYDLGRELEELIVRGVRVAFVFADGEPGIELLRIEGGAALKRIGSRCRVRIIERGDHSFSHSQPRATLEDVLSEELFAPTDFGLQRRTPTDHAHAENRPV